MGNLSRRAVLLGGLSASLVFAQPTLAAGSRHPGSFNPVEPDVRLGSDGRKATLLLDFEYIDLKGESWMAPKDSVVDGASIPQVFWSYIGGPFEGRYRNASIIHDVYCDKRSRASESVHAVFYEAMLKSGVDPMQAWIMYMAVNTFGPSWKMEPPKVCSTPGGQAEMQVCFQRAGEKPKLAPSVPITSDTMDVFLKGLSASGGASEVERLRTILPDALVR